jgi:methionine synthase II (cobalamin-independent)
MLFLRRTAQINGEDRVIISGTSKLNTDQFTDFLKKVQSDASTEFGIKLPTPDDLYFESFKQEYGRYIHY